MPAGLLLCFWALLFSSDHEKSPVPLAQGLFNSCVAYLAVLLGFAGLLGAAGSAGSAGCSDSIGSTVSATGAGTLSSSDKASGWLLNALANTSRFFAM